MIARNQLQTGHELSQVLPLLKRGKVLAMLKLRGGITSVDVGLIPGTFIHTEGDMNGFTLSQMEGGVAIQNRNFPIFPIFSHFHHRDIIIS